MTSLHDPIRSRETKNVQEYLGRVSHQGKMKSPLVPLSPVSGAAGVFQAARRTDAETSAAKQLHVSLNSAIPPL